MACSDAWTLPFIVSALLFSGALGQKDPLHLTLSFSFHLYFKAFLQMAQRSVLIFLSWFFPDLDYWTYSSQLIIYVHQQIISQAAVEIPAYILTCHKCRASLGSCQ